MTYDETIQYLFHATPLFQHVGGAAYKEGLSNTHLLDAHFGHPHSRYVTLHVAGTNGKGSCSSTLAAIYQAAGYKTGLYTSPHLVDFRERIRVNGEMIPEQYVVDFVARERAFFEPLHPSFFELTTAMAFQYFADCQVDVAIIEVGLGGRLDCTNIIRPLLSIITNVSFDHTQFLGHTLTAIAGEKAGIMKKGIPVVIGEANAETRPVFETHARDCGCDIHFAEEEDELLAAHSGSSYNVYHTRHYGEIMGQLTGACQIRNARTLLTAFRLLAAQDSRLQPAHLAVGFAQVCDLTGLRGRWETLSTSPLVVCDTGHNPAGWEYIARQLASLAADKRQGHAVLGFCQDKDVDAILRLLPSGIIYHWARASVPRALSGEELLHRGQACHLTGKAYPSVAAAYAGAMAEAGAEDFIFIGGSNFVVADLFTAYPSLSAQRPTTLR